MVRFRLGSAEAFPTGTWKSRQTGISVEHEVGQTPVTWSRYQGSGFTSKWTRGFFCLVFVLWGLAVAFLSLERHPTRAHAKYERAVAIAKEAGLDTEAIPKPPDNAMWNDGVPEWTIVGLVMAGLGLAALTEGLRRKRKANTEEESEKG